MRKFCWMLLVLLAFSVYAEDEKVVVVGSAKELKGIAAKKVIWKKDEAKMVRVPYEVVLHQQKMSLLFTMSLLIWLKRKPLFLRR